MVVDDEPFLSVVGARLVWADDPEYLAFSEEHATRARTRFTRAAPDSQQLVANAAERAIQTVTDRLGGGSHPRILRADVIYALSGSHEAPLAACHETECIDQVNVAQFRQ